MWSLSTLQRALPQQKDYPILVATRSDKYESMRGLSWQKHRSWCDTGGERSVNESRDGRRVVVTVIDPDAEAKKELD